MEPKLIILNEIKIVGTSVRTTNQAEADPSTTKIQGNWERFFANNIAEKIPNKQSRGLLGIYTDYESDHHGAYTHLVAVAVHQVEETPEGLVSLTVPAGRYFVFTAEGELPKAVVDTWSIIWDYFSEDSDYKRSYTVDFEEYDLENPNKVDIYIAIG